MHAIRGRTVELPEAVVEGTIFNAPALRRRFAERLGASIESDAEIVAHLYADYGAALVHALDGPFALMVDGAGGEERLLARDRFGERALHWRRGGDGAPRFGTRLAALVDDPRSAELEPAAVAAVLNGRAIPEPLTIVRGVLRLPPAHLLRWHASTGEERIERWWARPARTGELVESAAEVHADSRARLAAAVARRSGGEAACGLLDGTAESIAVAAIAAEDAGTELATVTVSDDAELAARTRRVARAIGTSHVELSLSEAEDRLPALLRSLDEPAAHPRVLAVAGAAAAAPDGSVLLTGGDAAPDVLARAAATFGRELRFPCLDTRYADLACALGAEHVARSLLAQQGLEDGPVPVELSTHAAWLRGRSGTLLEEAIEAGAIAAEDWFDRDPPRRALAEHRSGVDRSGELWPLLTLSVWLDGFRGDGRR